MWITPPETRFQRIAGFNVAKAILWDLSEVYSFTADGSNVMLVSCEVVGFVVVECYYLWVRASVSAADKHEVCQWSVSTLSDVK